MARGTGIAPGVRPAGAGAEAGVEGSRRAPAPETPPAGAEERPASAPSWRRWARWLVPFLALAAAALALAVLHHELRAYRYADIVRELRALPPPRLLAAVALTAAGYAALLGYDALALRYVRRRLPARRVALASFIAYAFSQTLGYAALTGASIRYRFWSAWGLSAAEIAQGVAFVSVTFWIGVVTIAGAALAFHPADAVVAGALPDRVLRPLGGAMLAVVAAWLVWNAVARRALEVRGWRFGVPGVRLAAAQVAVSVLDWTIAAAVLRVLLPPAPGLAFPTWLGLFLLAQTIGLASHVPGGVGVFESLVVVMLRPWVPAASVIGALIAWRAVYYLLPFSIAAASLAAHEIAHRREPIGRVARLAARWVSPIAPQVVSAATFVAGAALLFSGATPGVHGRLVRLERALPLGVIELAHLVGSVAGMWLLLLALGLRRRLGAAYHLTVAALAVGVAASLLKGGDWEEALLLCAVLGVVVPSRAHFYRRAALTTETWSPAWIVAVVLVLGGTLWLGFFSYQHVAYSADLWWRFTLHGDAPRFLRGMVGATGAAVAFGIVHLLRPAAVAPPPPTEAEIERALAVAAESGCLGAHLAALGDKALMFGARGGLLMYAVSGRSWIALGDPIGAPDERVELAWRFREEADRHGGWPAFYEVGPANLPLYIDLGLTLLKLGEEARVPLEGWSLEGGHRKGLRRAVREAERAGARFEIVPAAEVPAILPVLRRISDAWLATRRTREKGFSLGFFDERYLRRFPVAVVRLDARIVAFANLWLAPGHGEMSVDLMRYDAAAPDGVMDYLFVRLMLWGRDAGYRAFNLGMAPLSGFEARALAPLWSRVGALVYRHGEHFYHFRGLRQYKEKFDPLWEPRYLAAPGGLALPRILASTAALVSGGIVGVVAR